MTIRKSVSRYEHFVPRGFYGVQDHLGISDFHNINKELTEMELVNNKDYTITKTYSGVILESFDIETHLLFKMKF